MNVGIHWKVTGRQDEEENRLVDYVPQASFKLDRNPNYWQQQPLHPGDDEAYANLQAAWPDEDEMWRIFKEWQLDVLANAWTINIPPYFEYQVWWPWLKEYHGEWSLGYIAEAVSYAPYVRLDTELKKSMGY